MKARYRLYVREDDKKESECGSIIEKRFPFKYESQSSWSSEFFKESENCHGISCRYESSKEESYQKWDMISEEQRSVMDKKSNEKGRNQKREDSQERDRFGRTEEFFVFDVICRFKQEYG
jgi:hypothetical protein